MEWGPTTVEADWGHVRVDGSIHRTYRAPASWPQLPVPTDWLGLLLTDARDPHGHRRHGTGTHVPGRRGPLDREVMAREADAEMKERKGFRINARRNASGSPTWRPVSVSCPKATPSSGSSDSSTSPLPTSTPWANQPPVAVEQAAGQSLVDLRPLEARHDLGWVVCLPVGRNIATRVTP